VPRQGWPRFIISFTGATTLGLGIRLPRRNRGIEVFGRLEGRVLVGKFQGQIGGTWRLMLVERTSRWWREGGSELSGSSLFEDDEDA